MSYWLILYGLHQHWCNLHYDSLWYDFVQLHGSEFRHMPRQDYHQMCTYAQRRLMYQIIRSRALICQRLGNGENNEILEQLNNGENNRIRNVAAACVIYTLRYLGKFVELQNLHQRMPELAANGNQITVYHNLILEYIDMPLRRIIPFNLAIPNYELPLIITPIAFLHLFVQLLQCYVPVHLNCMHEILGAAIDYIHTSHPSLSITRFKPSVIAAAAILWARSFLVGQFCYLATLDFFNSKIGSLYIDGLLQCADEIQALFAHQ